MRNTSHPLRVLIIGWKPDAAVTALHGHGAELTCAVAPGDLAAARAHPGASRVVPVANPTDLESVLSGLAREGLSPASFDVVCTAGEFELVAASALGETAGRAALPLEAALALRDKFVQKQRIQEAGLPVTACRVVEGLAGVAASGDDLPCVIKPLAGAGTMDTHRVETAADLARIRAVLKGSADGLWLVERFVPGTELHVDGVVRDGRVLGFGVSRYLNNLIDFHDGALVGSFTLDPAHHSELYERTGDLVTRAMGALGHRDGVFHLEMFHQADGGLVFSECAGRVGGGKIATALQRQFGIDLHDEWARSVLRLPSALGPERSPGSGSAGSHGWIHLTAPAGRIEHAPGEADLLAQPGVVTAEVDIRVGDVAPGSTAATSLRAARAVVRGSDATEAEARLRSLADWFRAAVVTADPLADTAVLREERIPSPMSPIRPAGDGGSERIPPRRVLLVGWRPRAIVALHAHGADVTCVHRPGENRSDGVPDDAYRSVEVPDPRSVEDVLAGLARIDRGPQDYDLVCSQHEFTLVTAAVAGGGANWMAPETAVRLRDKAVQKETVRRAGIPVARCRVIGDIGDLPGVAELPAVVKPLAGAATRHTFVLDSAESVDRAVRQLKEEGIGGPWLVEEFVTGNELLLDGVVRGGEVVFLSVSRYLQNAIQVRSGAFVGAVALDPKEHDELYAQARALCRDALGALGHREGVFHLEAFRQPDRLVFSECGGRVSGGKAYLVIREKFGVDLHDEWARATLGLRSAVADAVPSSDSYGHVYLAVPGGRLTSLPGQDEVLARDGVILAEIAVQAGQTMADPSRASDSGAGTAVVVGADEGEVERRLTGLARWFADSVTVEPGQDA
ncbi:ATP-grasp domain-containing protein [Kitasatospora sp. NPDC101157]|uniref:ATP-grasp domain-containing protein n=1 Tax=Kitasatospora sp. NPDC101157 TaxID=3364098 RepID=UPI003829CC72